MRQSSRLPSKRARYARTDIPSMSFRVNDPDGFASSYPPGNLWWIGSDQTPSFIRPTAPASLSAVTRATSLIANTISSLPLRLLTGGPTPGSSTIEIPPHRWLADPQLHRRDDRFGPTSIPSSIRITRSQFWAGFIRSALLGGMGYVIYEASADGGPVAGTFRTLNPDYVSAHVDRDEGVVRRIGTGGEYVDTDRDGELVLGGRVYRLLELNNPLDSPDEYGITRGVLEMHAAELGLSAQAVSYARGMYRSGTPSGYLKTSIPNFKKAQADVLREQWMESHGGDSRSVAVLNATTEYVPISLSPVDMALINMRQMSLLDVANAFGVPVHMLGGSDGGSNTYSNAESRNLDFRQFSLSPWVVAFEEELTSLTPLGQFVIVDFRGLLRSDTTSRYAAYSAALKDGWLTVNEVRRTEGMQPFDEEPEKNPPAGITEGGEGGQDAGTVV